MRYHLSLIIVLVFLRCRITLLIHIHEVTVLGYQGIAAHPYSWCNCSRLLRKKIINQVTYNRSCQTLETSGSLMTFSTLWKKTKVKNENITLMMWFDLCFNTTCILFVTSVLLQNFVNHTFFNLSERASPWLSIDNTSLWRDYTTMTNNFFSPLSHFFHMATKY